MGWLLTLVHKIIWSVKGFSSGTNSMIPVNNRCNSGHLPLKVSVLPLLSLVNSEIWWNQVFKVMNPWGSKSGGDLVYLQYRSKLNQKGPNRLYRWRKDGSWLVRRPLWSKEKKDGTWCRRKVWLPEGRCASVNTPEKEIKTATKEQYVLGSYLVHKGSAISPTLPYFRALQ